MFEKWKDKKIKEKEKWLQKADDIVCFMNHIIIGNSMPLDSSTYGSIPIGALRIKFVDDYNKPTTKFAGSSYVHSTGDFGYALQQFTEEGWKNKRLIKSNSNFTDSTELDELNLMLQGIKLLKEVR